MRYSRTLLLSLILICGVVIAGCSSSTNHASAGIEKDRFILPKGEAITASFTNSILDGMKGIAENNSLQLYIDDQTAEIAVFDKNSGEIWRSNPADLDSDSLAIGVNKDMLSAQAGISFNTVSGQEHSVNSYTDSTANKQMAFETIPSGIRVTYQFGTDAKSAEDLPQKISRARFEEFSSKLDNTGKRAFIIAYKEDEKNDVYVRNDDALVGLQLRRALDAFEAAGYTEEELLYDIAENNLDQEKAEARIFFLSIEYTLDGDNLIVRVPVDSIQYPENYPVNRISFMHFFGAGGSNEQGSLFVPDGSGALIHFNNGKASYPAYQQDVYGRDLTLYNVDFLSGDQKVRMPVFGSIKENSAFLGIIEQGVSVAMINADVSGKLNSYNYVYPSFYVLNKDSIRLSAGNRNRELYKFQEDSMKTDYVVRYAFLTREDANYQGLARYYQQYLVNNKMLPKITNDSSEDIPFYLQLIGSIDKQKHALGVPYQSLEPLTTFEDAKGIV